MRQKGSLKHKYIDINEVRTQNPKTVNIQYLAIKGELICQELYICKIILELVLFFFIFLTESAISEV